MSNLFETKDIQRSLISFLLKKPLFLRMHFGGINRSWFSGKERLFIFDLIKQNLEQSGSLLTKAVFEFNLNNIIKEDNRASFLLEWGLIDGTSVEEDGEQLISMLHKAQLAKQLTSVCTEVVGKIESGSIEEASTILRSRAVEMNISRLERPVTNLSDWQERDKLIEDKIANPGKYLGIPSGFQIFDSKVGGFFKSELTVFSAITGVGKSTLMKMIERNIILNKGIRKNVLHVTNEENLMQVNLKFDALLTRIPYAAFKRATISNEERKRWKATMEEIKRDEYGKIFVKEVSQLTTVFEIEKTMMELEAQGFKIDIVFVDYMDLLRPISNAWSDVDEQGKVAQDLKALAITFDVPVITLTQAATAAEQKQEKGQNFGKYDVYGSKQKIHAANVLGFIIQRGRDLTRLENHEVFSESECDWFWEILIAKNRDGACFSFDAIQRVHTGIVEPTNRLAGEHCDVNAEVIMIPDVVPREDELIGEFDSVAVGEREGKLLEEAEGEVDVSFNIPKSEPVAKTNIFDIISRANQQNGHKLPK